MIASRNLIVRTLLLAAGMLALASIGRAQPGAVYTLSNTADTNRVLVFSGNPHGGLDSSISYPTGGKGSGAGLGSQGALTLTDDGRWLLAVNAGSNSLSVFSVHKHALVLTDLAASGGLNPISVTVADNLVYVLNAGGAVGSSDNISGFYLSKHGQLIPLPGSTRPLSGANVGPAQVSFGLRGDVLVVTEKGTSRVDSFTVDENGRAGPVVSTPSSGSTPFGFAISSKGYAFVSEAVSSALSSYRLQENAGVALVTGSLINHQAAACWAVLSKNEKFAYTANAATNTISGYRVASNGVVALLNPTGVTAVTDAHPIDMAVSNNGRFLYSLNSNSGTLVAFAVGEDGSLTRVDQVGDLPASVAGLAAR